MNGWDGIPPGVYCVQNVLALDFRRVQISEKNRYLSGAFKCALTSAKKRE